MIPLSDYMAPGSKAHHGTSVFVLKLPGSENQVEASLNSLKENGIEAQVWRAEDYDDIRLENDERIGSHAWFYAHHGGRATKGELAQYLLHYRLMCHALAAKLERILVIESGSLVVPGFGKLNNQLSQLEDSFEFISLTPVLTPSAVKDDRQEWMLPLHNQHSIVPSLEDPGSAVNYVASLSGLAKLAPLLMPIRAQLGSSLGQTFWHRSVRAFEVWPPAAHAPAYFFKPQHLYPNKRILPLPLRVAKSLLAIAVRAIVSRRLKNRLITYRQRHRAYLDRWSATK